MLSALFTMMASFAQDSLMHMDCIAFLLVLSGFHARQGDYGSSETYIVVAEDYQAKADSTK